jgi:hypothetical protein
MRGARDKGRTWGEVNSMGARGARDIARTKDSIALWARELDISYQKAKLVNGMWRGVRVWLVD